MPYKNWILHSMWSIHAIVFDQDWGFLCCIEKSEKHRNDLRTFLFLHVWLYCFFQGPEGSVGDPGPVGLSGEKVRLSSLHIAVYGWSWWIRERNGKSLLGFSKVTSECLLKNMIQMNEKIL